MPLKRAALALALCAGSASAAPASPACALLSADEAAAALGGAATVADGGPSASGVTACGWRGKAAGELNVQILAPVAFSSAATTAQTYYDLMVQGMQASHQAGEEIAGLGEKAYLVTLDGGVPSSVITILKTGKIATISAIGVAGPQALVAARQIAARF